MIGAGNMGAALARGILEANSCSWNLTIVDPSSPFTDELGAYENATTLTTLPADHSTKFDCLVLAVKPQLSAEVLPGLSHYVGKDGCIISVMAGKSVTGIQRDLGAELPVIRAMPNLPAQVGMGMTTVFASESVAPDQLSDASELFQTVGEVLSVSSEELIDAGTAVAGSGPGFIYHLLTAANEQAIELGFSAEEASLLVSQTVLGALKLSGASDQTYKTLEESVTSPNGTTEAGIKILKDGKAQELLRETVKAAYVRAQELSD